MPKWAWKAWMRERKNIMQNYWIFISFAFYSALEAPIQDEIIFIFSRRKGEKCSATFIYRIELPLQEREERAKVQRWVKKWYRCALRQLDFLMVSFVPMPSQHVQLFPLQASAALHRECLLPSSPAVLLQKGLLGDVRRLLELQRWVQA